MMKSYDLVRFEPQFHAVAAPMGSPEDQLEFDQMVSISNCLSNPQGEGHTQEEVINFYDSNRF